MGCPACPTLAHVFLVYKKLARNLSPRIQTILITVLKKRLVLVLLYHGPLSLETRTKLNKFLKSIIICCKLKIVFKKPNTLPNAFHFKDHIPKEITSGAVYKFQCGLYDKLYYDECARHLNVSWTAYRNLTIYKNKS